MCYDRATSSEAAYHDFCQPHVKAVWAALKEVWPALRDVGCYVNRSQRGSTSLSVHAVGRARDGGGPQSSMKAAAEALKLNGLTIGVQCVIYYRQIWSCSQGGWRPYGGVNAHTDHFHYEVPLTPVTITHEQLVAALRNPGGAGPAQGGVSPPEDQHASDIVPWSGLANVSKPQSTSDTGFQPASPLVPFPSPTNPNWGGCS